MIATLQAICYWFFELLTPPEIKQIRFITHDCVSKIIPSTRDEDGYPISGQDVVPNRACAASPEPVACFKAKLNAASSARLTKVKSA